MDKHPQITSFLNNLLKPNKSKTKVINSIKVIKK